MALNIARLDLVSIQLVVLCAETGSLSAASKRVNCALSTGSHRLSAIESAVGRPLFFRRQRGLEPTATGEHFVRHARAILEQVHRLSVSMVEHEPVRTAPPHF